MVQQIHIDTNIILHYKFYMIKRFGIFLVVLIFLLSACSKSGINTPAPITNDFTPQATQIPTPTPTPIPEIRIDNAESLLLAGDYDAAYIEFVQTSTQTNDPELVAHSLLGMGRALFLKKDFRGAVNQFSTLLINYPEGDARNTSYFFLAQAYDALDQPRLAADAYAEYLNAYPTSPLTSEINQMRANALFKYGDYANAILAYQAAISTANSNNYDQLQIDLAAAENAAGNIDNAINLYLTIIETSQSNYHRAQADLLLGRIYTQLGFPDQAYARYQHAVNNYPEQYDSYSALAALINDGQIVDQLQRGIVNYHVGQYGIAIQALDDYMNANADHTAIGHAYKAKSLDGLFQHEAEIAEWQKVIRDHSNEPDYYLEAYTQIANTQWSLLNQYEEAAQTCLTFVASVPSDTVNAPLMLEKAAYIYVDGGYLSSGAQTYERVLNEYPGSDNAYQDLFKAGILYYRLQEYVKAQTTFERLIVLTLNPYEQAAANMWVAKSLEKLGDTTGAAEYYLKAATIDPGGYYGIRASQIINGITPFPDLKDKDLGVDYVAEKLIADRWVINTFQLDPAIDLSSVGDLVNNPIFQRAEEYSKLGLRDQARREYEILRSSLVGDVVNTYRLMNRTLELGYYYTAIYSSRHVLDLAGLSQAATLTVPPDYFNHIRFGVFFREIVVAAANEHELDPILIFSLIRQESLFDSSIISIASAKGLMQITPNTAVDIVNNYGWPQNFVADDLYRPMVNIRLGIHYLKRGLDLYDGNYYAALASYNAGDTFATRWVQLSGGDIDLFLEIISFSETREYIKSIVENYQIYDNIYSRPQ